MSNTHASIYLKSFINGYMERIPSQHLNVVTRVTELPTRESSQSIHQYYTVG